VTLEDEESVGPSRFALAGLFALIVVVSLAGLLYRPPADSSMSATVAAAAYRREAQALADRGLVLAPGWKWPRGDALFPRTAPDGSPIGYGPGAGQAQADLYWFYSWARRATSKALPPAARRAALEELLRVRETVYYRRLIPDTRHYLDQELAAALKGDLSRLRTDVRSNAPAP
jgi:hypothetical protein